MLIVLGKLIFPCGIVKGCRPGVYMFFGPAGSELLSVDGLTFGWRYLHEVPKGHVPLALKILQSSTLTAVCCGGRNLRRNSIHISQQIGKF